MESELELEQNSDGVVDGALGQLYEVGQLLNQLLIKGLIVSLGHCTGIPQLPDFLWVLRCREGERERGGVKLGEVSEQ